MNRFIVCLDHCMKGDEWWPIVQFTFFKNISPYINLGTYILLHTYILILNKIISELHYYLLFSIFRYTYIIEFATDIYHSAKCICINYASLKIGITIFVQLCWTLYVRAQAEPRGGRRLPRGEAHDEHPQLAALPKN